MNSFSTLGRTACLVVFPVFAAFFETEIFKAGFSDDSVAPAAVFTVDSTGDVGDSNTADGVCDDGTGSCTLRAAIEQANGLAGTDTINFSIGATAPQTISPLMPLPEILEAVTIDGFSQPGSSPNTSTTGLNTVVGIVLNGSGAGAGADGLVIRNGSTTVRGLAINNFSNDGIVFLENSDFNTVVGCFIGTDATGTVDAGNASDGIESRVLIITRVPDNNIIGGTNPEDRNLISGNNANGINFLFGGGNTIRGNIIGLNAAGTSALGNGGNGALADTGNTVGGTAAGARNIISGNGNFGLSLDDNNLVQGNYIGTDVSGTVDLGNSQDGIFMNVSSGNTIGGSAAGAGNLISGNNNDGIQISTSGANTVQGNLIGTQADGVTCLGNSGHGVHLFAGGANNATIGGTAAGEGNTIACNSLDGVSIAPSAGASNMISGNSIHSNGGLGIDLGSDGITLNDAGDGDTGPNNLQNYPVIDIAVMSSTRVIGSLNSTPSTMFRLEFFNSAAADPSGSGEGATFIGSFNVTTDAAGDVSYDHTFASFTAAVGSFISATATDLSTNDTSEFSGSRQVTAPTAAAVVISGRVLRADGRGIPGAMIRMTFETGETKTRLTNPFGYYLLNEIPVGSTCIVEVFHKSHSFVVPVRVLNIDDSITNLNFVAK